MRVCFAKIVKQLPTLAWCRFVSGAASQVIRTKRHCCIARRVRPSLMYAEAVVKNLRHDSEAVPKNMERPFCYN